MYLVAPTTSPARRAAVAARSGGFLYCVSLVGRDRRPDLAAADRREARPRGEGRLAGPGRGRVRGLEAGPRARDREGRRRRRDRGLGARGRAGPGRPRRGGAVGGSSTNLRAATAPLRSPDGRIRTESRVPPPIGMEVAVDALAGSPDASAADRRRRGRGPGRVRAARRAVAGAGARARRSSITRSHADAHDAVQDALLAAWQGLDRLRDPDAFPAWFRTLVVRSALRVARKRGQVVELDVVRAPTTPTPASTDPSTAACSARLRPPVGGGPRPPHAPLPVGPAGRRGRRALGIPPAP